MLKINYTHLEPCDCGDGVADNVEEEEGIGSLLGRNLICRLHILGLLSLGGQGNGSFVPVLRWIYCYR